MIDVLYISYDFLSFYILDFQNGKKVSVFLLKNGVKLIIICQLNVWNVVFNIYFIIYSTDAAGNSHISFAFFPSACQGPSPAGVQRF